MRPAVSTPVLTLLFAVAPTAAFAQAGGDLNEQRQRGRQVFAQSCGICHLQPVLGVKTYGPPLNKTAAAGNDDAMRAIITNGTARMPALKHDRKPAEIDAIGACVSTGPVNPSPNAPKQGEMR